MPSRPLADTQSHGDLFDIPMCYYPGAAETLIALDHVCRESTHYAIVDSHTTSRMTSDTPVLAARVTSLLASSLWYIARLVPGMESLDTMVASTLCALNASVSEGDGIVALPPFCPVPHLLYVFNTPTHVRALASTVGSPRYCSTGAPTTPLHRLAYA